MFPGLGTGVGLRAPHFDHIFTHWPQVDWFEVITENFCDARGRPRAALDRIAERYPIVLHGVSLSVGGTDPLDLDYLRKVKRLAQEVSARWVSDHLCWTGTGGRNTHDLLPLPMTEATALHVAKRVRKVQDFLERPLVLENPSTYLGFTQSTMSEWAFISLVLERAGCYLLLDVNNVYVSAFNQGFDPEVYLSSIPRERVAQMHLAGHSHEGTHIVDTHDRRVAGEVWALYEKAIALMGRVPTSIEWDDCVPEFPVVMEEARKITECQPYPHPALSGKRERVRSVSAEIALPELQRWMQELITAPSVNESPEISERILPSAHLSPAERVDIYRRSYLLRLVHCLRESLPLLRAELGDDLFDRFAHDYLRQHPPTSYTLELLDQHFLRYLRDNRPDRDLSEKEREWWPDHMIDLVRRDQERRAPWRASR